MSQKIEYEVNQREYVYYWIRLFFSTILYAALIYGILVLTNLYNLYPAELNVILVYIAIIAIFAIFGILRFCIFIGYLKGNAVRITEKQFPEIYAKVANQSDLLGLTKIPKVYILQSGGFLNAYATRFFGSNYIVLFSEVVDAAYEQDKNVLEFIIGHELGHIKRKHLLKKMILFPSALIPFLRTAYSRACEYTCDNIGYTLCPEGAQNGMLLLASGRGLFKKVNLKEYISQSYTDDGFWFWISEKLSSHPHITKRLEVFGEKTIAKPVNKIKTEVEPTIEESLKTNSDYSKYMPK